MENSGETIVGPTKTDLMYNAFTVTVHKYV